MLKTVIGHDDVTFRMCRQQRRAGGDTVAPDKHRHIAATGEQEWLIAHFGGLGIRFRHTNLPLDSAISATDDSRMKPLRAQPLNQPDHQRRLAATTDRQVADDNHRHGQTDRFQDSQPIQPTTRSNNQAEQP